MKYLPILALLLLNFLAGCLIYGLDENDFDSDGDVWMSIAPIQCMGNQWEQDWLAANNNNYDAYPADPSTPELEPEEKKIIQEYYQRQRVRIQEIDSFQWDGAVCLACSCAAGYTLLARIDASDRTRMLELGFVDAEPRG